ncbi:MAG: hypothetical protein ANABAC_3349 [Anaerolineae bacterium]|nr:MAG: hypothetical protein ANABAC_3349 [Anaerolineae bacterium]
MPIRFDSPPACTTNERIAIKFYNKNHFTTQQISVGLGLSPAVIMFVVQGFCADR